MEHIREMMNLGLSVSDENTRVIYHNFLLTNSTSEWNIDDSKGYVFR